MPGINLTSIEAAERSAILKIDNYKVDLDLTTGDETFNSKAVITFSATPGSNTFIDAMAKRIIVATLNGQPVDVSNYDGESVFLNNLAAQNELVIEMEAIYSKTGEGFIGLLILPMVRFICIHSTRQMIHVAPLHLSINQI